MADDPSRALDRILETATSGGAPGPCPDENDLAALAEGGLGGTLREATASHLVACGPCREVVRGLMAGAEAARPAGRRLRFPRRWAVAAAVLLALGAAVGGGVVLHRQGAARTDAPDASAAALAVAAARLAREAPEAFGDFRPRDVSDLPVARGEVLRGVALPSLPSGRILDPRPTFRWATVPGARTYRVSLLGPGGALWERTTSDTALSWPEGTPPLSAGARAAWSVVADDPHATSTERAFELVSAEEQARWHRAEVAASAVETPLRWLLLAQLALDRDLPAEAWIHASRYRESRPGDSLGAATHAAAASRLAAR